MPATHAAHWRSAVAVPAVDSAWPVGHVEKSVHTRSLVLVGAVDSNATWRGHVVSSAHTRFVVVVGVVVSYSVPLHVVCGVQLLCPVWPWYWPAAQAVQLPGDPYVPAAQGLEEVHARSEVAVGAVVSPAGQVDQGTHASAPVVVLNVPVGHGPQLLSLLTVAAVSRVDAVSPAAQTVNAVHPWSELLAAPAFFAYCPEGHGVHISQSMAYRWVGL